jgi:hypothetical protein
MKRFGIVFMITAAAMVLVSVCHANTVSWNYNRNGGAYSTQSTDFSGVGMYSAAYWNDSSLDGRTTDLLDNTGTATTIDITRNSYNTWSIQGSAPAIDTDGSHNKAILNGYLNSGPAGWNPPLIYSRVTLSQIEYASYEIVVYFSSDVAGREGYVTDGTTTYYFNTVGPASIASGNALFVRATNTTTDGYTVAANYAVFSGLSGASQNITVQMRDLEEWGGIAAIQIVSNPYSAKTPSPANGATLVPVDTALSWVAPEAFTPTGYNVRIGTDPNTSTILVTNTPNTTVDPSPSGNLAYSTKYYWRVDTLEPNTPSPIVHTGNVWNFTTVPTTPIISTQPSNLLVASGTTATFTIVAASPSTITYAWYKTTDAVNNTPGDDVSVGTNSATLSFTATADGFYYCKATNSGGATYSNVANLGIKRQVAHWALDALGGTGNQYVDSSPEGLHPADANGIPTFVAGAGASTGNGVTITSGTGWASAGTWDPSQYSKQITISMWVKSTGNFSTWRGLLAKRNAWGVDSMMWRLESNSGNGAVVFGSSSGSVVSNIPLPTNAWDYVAVTFDGTTANIYRNGVLDASGTVSFNNKTDANLMIGAGEKTDAGGVDMPFDGDLDDIQIYNYALNNTDVADLFRAVTGKAVCINSYASQYDFDGNCKVDLADFVALAAAWLDCGRYPESMCN